MINQGLINQGLINQNAVVTIQAYGLGLLPFAVNGSILNDPSALGLQTVIRYAAELVAGGVATEVPISSWQATLQLDRQNYAQIVIPAATEHTAEINAAESFRIYSRVTTGNSTSDYLLLDCAIDSLSVATSARRETATLRGYFAQDYIDNSASQQFERKLTGIRTITSQNGTTTVRCAVDFLLMPNQLASYQSTNLTVSYINYFVSVTDAYMDVGNRP